MKIIVIGKSGQLAWELAQLATRDIELLCLGREQVDITDPFSLLATLKKINADTVINASAYTAVDLAETEVDSAFRLNALAVANIAKVCSELKLHLTHISTDFVFAGDKGSPYLPDDLIAPLGVYGASKAEGERLITQFIPNNSCIVRTSWVYSCHGKNFVKTMLSLMQSKDELAVISDQIGSPTWAKGLAQVCLAAAINNVHGIHHYTDTGVASWYDFAVAIQELAFELGLLTKRISIKPIRSEEYPTPAKRPHYSVLDKTSISVVMPEVSLVHWREQLSNMLVDLKSIN